jgi:hypothetical protein
MAPANPPAGIEFRILKASIGAVAFAPMIFFIASNAHFRFLRRRVEELEKEVAKLREDSVRPVSTTGIQQVPLRVAGHSEGGPSGHRPLAHWIVRP